MAEVIKMPKMSDTMEEGVIASWQKKVGDAVESGDILAEVETDKATMELEAYDDGTLLHIAVEEGNAVAVDGIIAVIGEKGENIDDLLKGENGKSFVETPSDKQDKPAEKSEAETQPVSSEPADTSNINATVIRMPKMSDTMEEGVIASWQKKVGDTVESGDVLAEVETDKATMELEAYDDGTLLHIGVGSGESVAVDGIIAIVGEDGADYQALLNAEKHSVGSEKKENPAEELVQADSQPQEKQESGLEKSSPRQNASTNATKAPPSADGSNGQSSGKGRIFASPLAKRMALEMGYDISQIKGSGDHKRVTKKDVEAFVPPTPEAKPAASPQTDQSSASQQAAAEQVVLPPVVGEEDYTESKVTQMRKTIARRLVESKFSAPHFYLTMEINMDKAIEARNSMNETAPIKISFNDMVIKSAAMSLRQHPGSL